MFPPFFFQKNIQNHIFYNNNHILSLFALWLNDYLKYVFFMLLYFYFYNYIYIHLYNQTFVFFPVLCLFHFEISLQKYLFKFLLYFYII